jgi:hypothetical protein
MPIFSVFSNDYFPSGPSFDVFSMPPKDVDDSSDAVPAHKTSGSTSILIFISAQALSSVGFAVVSIIRILGTSQSELRFLFLFRSRAFSPSGLDGYYQLL